MKSIVPVAVVIPCYQCTATIERAIASVAAQTYLPERVILIDDFSQDSTLEKLNELSKIYPENWIHVIAKSHNSGPGDSRNVGWEIATSNYVAFLDADDSWHPSKLQIQYTYMERSPDISLTGHLGETVTDSPDLGYDPIYSSDLSTRRIFPLRALFFNDFITRSVMVKRDIPMRFDSQMRYSEDYLLWLQIINSGLKAEVINIPLAYSYKSDYGKGGLSGQLWNMEKGELTSLRRIFKDYDVNVLLQLTSASFSFAKYIRRVIVSKTRSLRSSYIARHQ